MPAAVAPNTSLTEPRLARRFRTKASKSKSTGRRSRVAFIKPGSKIMNQTRIKTEFCRMSNLENIVCPNNTPVSQILAESTSKFTIIPFNFQDNMSGETTHILLACFGSKKDADVAEVNVVVAGGDLVMEGSKTWPDFSKGYIETAFEPFKSYDKFTTWQGLKKSIFEKASHFIKKDMLPLNTQIASY